MASFMDKLKNKAQQAVKEAVKETVQNAGNKTYAEWQFEKGYDTIELFCGGFTTDEMFKGKKVLDMGCGAAGKSLYYVTLGAEKVTGAEIVSHYKAEAEALACAKGLSDRFEFVLGSALQLPFPDKSFDTIIMNDFMEHIHDPEGALRDFLDPDFPRLFEIYCFHNIVSASP